MASKRDLREIAREGLGALRGKVARELKAVAVDHAAASEALERALRFALRGRFREQVTRGVVVHVAETASRVLRAEIQRVGERLVAGTPEALRAAAEEARRAWGRGAISVDMQRAQAAITMATKELAAVRARAAAHSAVLSSVALRSRLAVAPIERRKVELAVREALDAHQGELWRVERLARTEAAHAFNAGQELALKAASADGVHVWKRWTELVDDWTGLPKDSRVGKDSLVLHGQVTTPNGLFFMPSDPRAPARMVGMSWAYPPNRPHDRSILTPWWPGCGIPGYVLERGHRRAV